MSDEKKVEDDGKLEIIATILGEKLRVILPSMGWSFDEAIVAADATDGLGTDEILDRCLAGDPRAWLAVLRVSYMRADRPFPSDEIGSVNMAALTEAFNQKVEEILGADVPPTSPSENESAGSGASSTRERKSAPKKVLDSA